MSEPAPPPSARIDALTSLRFVAAMAVVSFHYLPFIPLSPALLQLVSEGRVGVSFFFTLSGFILYYNYHTLFAEGVRPAAFARYFRARFARVFPMHLVAHVGVTLLVAYLMIQVPQTMVQRFGSEAASGFHVALSWLLNLVLVFIYVPLVNGPVLVYTSLWNPPSWSIACEFVFYAMFPFFVAGVLARVATASGLVRLLFVLYGIELVAFAAAVVGIYHVPFIHDKAGAFNYLVYYLPPFRIWEFFIGATFGKLLVIGQAPERLPSIWDSGLGRSVAIATLLGLIAAAVVGHVPGTPEVGVGAVLYGHARAYVLFTPLFGALIWLIARGPNFLTSVLEQRWFVLLGEASYSLYIIHWLPLTVLVSLGLLGSQPSVVTVFALIGGCVLSSVACFKFIEDPARRALRRSSAK